MLIFVINNIFLRQILDSNIKNNYLCDILVFFVRKRLRIKMGQMVTERGNHLFLYTFQSPNFSSPLYTIIQNNFINFVSKFFNETFIRQKYLWQI